VRVGRGQVERSVRVGFRNSVSLRGFSGFIHRGGFAG
jgi:hypothetical protein